MKILGAFLVSASYLLFANANLNYECTSDTSKFYLEIGPESAFVVDKTTFEVVKVLENKPLNQQSLFHVFISGESQQDWKIRVDETTAVLSFGDPKNFQIFNCNDDSL